MGIRKSEVKLLWENMARYKTKRLSTFRKLLCPFLNTKLPTEDKFSCSLFLNKYKQMFKKERES